MQHDLNNLLKAVVNQGPQPCRAEHMDGLPMTEKARSREDIMAGMLRWLAQRGYDDRDGNATVIAGYLVDYLYGRNSTGLMLCGPCGVGKTLALHMVARYVGAEFVTAAGLAQAYLRAEGGEAFTERYCSPGAVWAGGQQYVPDLVIDDVGSEPAVRSYGTPVDVVPVVVDAREALWKRCGARLHISTNLTRDEMLARYGERTVSRLQGLCVVVKVAGQDRRREHHRLALPKLPGEGA